MIKIEAINKAGDMFPDVWVTSDTHFNHANICRGVTNWRMPDGSLPIERTRDFKTLDEMNATIVDNINKVVMQDHILVHMGDWSFGGFESIRMLRDRLMCKNIYLILGNHDHHIRRNKGDVQELFTYIDKNTPMKIGKQMFELFHHPISSWVDMNKGVIHLHGHCHFTGDNRFGLGKRMDVGIDGHPEFRPYHVLREVIPLMNKRPIKSDLLFDHHTDEFIT